MFWATILYKYPGCTEKNKDKLYKGAKLMTNKEHTKQKYNRQRGKEKYTTNWTEDGIQEYDI